MSIKLRIVALTAGGLLLGVAGCSSSSNDVSSSPPSKSTSAAKTSAPAPKETKPNATKKSPPSQPAAMITIKDFKFSGPSSVPPGSKITVKNDDTTNHTVTATGAGSFDVTVDAGSTATFTAPSKAGSYPYVCTFHSDMTGTLVVK